MIDSMASGFSALSRWYSCPLAERGTSGRPLGTPPYALHRPRNYQQPLCPERVWQSASHQEIDGVLVAYEHCPPYSRAERSGTVIGIVSSSCRYSSSLTTSSRGLAVLSG